MTISSDGFTKARSRLQKTRDAREIAALQVRELEEIHSRYGDKEPDTGLVVRCRKNGTVVETWIHTSMLTVLAMSQSTTTTWTTPAVTQLWISLSSRSNRVDWIELIESLDPTDELKTAKLKKL